MLRNVLITSCLLIGVAAWAVPVENFSLLDQNGDAHELYYYSDADAVVVIVQGNACPIIRNALPDIREVRDRFADDNVVFLMLNANMQDTRESIQAEAAEWNIDMPILVDESQLVARGLGVTRTAEAFVINPSNWDLVYRGPLNDRIGYERQKAEADAHYVVDAVQAIKDGTEPVSQVDSVKGCLINIEEPTTEISYVEDVVPILHQNCVHCHTPGGIGPWAMSSYEMVKGFAPMMREVLRTNRMPPWHADPHIGEWGNDRSISIEDKKLLVDWIEAGAPRGEGEDPLGTIVASIEANRSSADWPLGEPDFIINVPAFEVPATGVVEYQNHEIASNITEDVWVRGIDVKPGDTNVLHHALVGSNEQGSRSRRGVFNNFLGGYAPGVIGDFAPEGTGTLIKKDSIIAVQMHYTPYGKTVVDETQIGLYTYDEPPERFVRHGVVINFNLAIPPNTKAHEEGAYIEFDKDAELYSILPHSHYRGRSSTFELELPNGDREVLLSVPDYDFNWQTGYAFAEPKHVPAGSKLIHKTIYDNSGQNFANPDPDKTVTWGLQSWDEMLYGAFVYRWSDETTAKPIHSASRFRAAQTVGMLDLDMDGGIQQSELRERLQKQLEPAFTHFDANGNAALEVEELFNYQNFVAQRRAQAQQAEAQSN
ncbi:MAG: redoxin domain-containing protein [Gammaproteobacteria bacterium]|nr:redoxin domain-containing protein [Gammaproteobacteria bacterium]